MSIVLTGVITDIFELQSFNNFRKKLFWLKELNNERGQHWELEVVNNDIPTLDKYKHGDAVSCHIDIMGRKSSKRNEEFVYNSLRCTKIEKIK